MSQSSIALPTTGPMSMATFVGSDLNPALAALASNFKGPSAPTPGAGSTSLTGQLWINDTNASAWVFNVYDGANWVAIGTLNPVTHAWSPAIPSASVTASMLVSGVAASNLGYTPLNVTALQQIATVDATPDQTRMPQFLYNATSGAANLNFDDVLFLIPIWGQSLALGAVDSGALVASTPLYPGRALMPSTGTRQDGTRFDSLVDLVEETGGPAGTAWANSYEAETVASSMVSHLLAQLDAQFTGVSPRVCSFVAAIGNEEYKQLKAGSPAFSRLLWAVEDVVRIAERSGLRVIVPAVIAIQGENNIVDTQQRTYVVALQQLQRDLANYVRHLTGQREPLVLMPVQTNRTSSANALIQPVLEAQMEVSHEQNVRVSGPIYAYPMSTYSAADSYIHKNNVGENRMGQMISRAVFAEIFGPGWQPLQPIDIYFTSPTNIRIEYLVPVPPLVIDTTGDISTAGLVNYLGWDVETPGGTYLTVTNAVVNNLLYTINGTVVDLTLSAAPTDGWVRVAYAMRRNDQTDTTPFDGPVYGPRGCLRDSAAHTNLYTGHVDNNWSVAFMRRVPTFS